MTKSRAFKFTVFCVILGGLTIAPSLVDDHAENTASIEAAPIGQPRFEVRWLRGGLEIAGHTRSNAHEKELLRVAGSEFSSSEISDEFTPFGPVPDHWPDTTLQMLHLLRATDSATATLNGDDLAIAGVVVDKTTWRDRRAEFMSALHSAVEVSEDILFIDDSLDATDLCARVFDGLTVGAINFEESSAVFRSSAYPHLDRVAALANACMESSVAITGHSDSSGSEAWNKALSLKRANAVGDYLIAKGVDPGRLQINGAGSAQPVADNATRYGRSLNRRIEIELGDTSRTRR